MNTSQNISVDELIDTMLDMYIPMEDIEDNVNSLDQNDSPVTIQKLRKISAECENILISILDQIIFTWILTVRDEHKDVLKHYYNKFRRLDYEYGHLEYIHPFNQSTLNKNKIKDINDVKEITSGILYSLKEIYETLSTHIQLKLNVIPILFRTPLKKLVSGILAVIFRWFKFTLKPPYSIACDNLRLAIWDTSFWTFWLKFGHKGP